MAPDKGQTPKALPIGEVAPSVWIQVDYLGLSALAGTLYGYAPACKEVVTSLNKSIRKITTDGGWKGKDASKFADAWDDDMKLAAKLSAFESDAAEIIDALAYKLAWIQKKLVERVDILQRDLRHSRDQADKDSIREGMKKLAVESLIESGKAQKQAAGQLTALYSGKKGGWSLVQALDSLQKNKNLDDKWRKSLSDFEDKLRDHLPDHKKSFMEGVESGAKIGGFWGGLGGGVVGGVVGIAGGPFAGISIPVGIGVGGSVGGLGGGVVGGVVGGVKSLF